MNNLPKQIKLSNDVARGVATGAPIVALESTVITHGLPQPENLKLAKDMEENVREMGAIPATIAILDGKIRIGLETEELEMLVTRDNLRKVSSRDVAGVVAMGTSGGTTVAGTLVIADQAGINVLATGGIGGVHRTPSFDISADLAQMVDTPMLVVCAGAKSIFIEWVWFL